MTFDRLRKAIRSALGLYPTLDLHGLGVQKALAETEAFLREAHAAREPIVRIVYGKGHRSPQGRGVLRHVIPQWLDNEGRELVERYERRPDQSGADGYVLVWLNGNRGQGPGTGGQGPGTGGQGPGTGGQGPGTGGQGRSNSRVLRRFSAL